jgi:hypothetical protein
VPNLVKGLLDDRLDLASYDTESCSIMVNWEWSDKAADILWYCFSIFLDYLG